MSVIKTILYVEDNTYNFLLVKAILDSDRQIRLLAASTGTQGLQMLQQQKIDLLLLDLNLPDMRGEEFLGKFRSAPDCTDLPVLVVSGETLPDRLQQLAPLGVTEVLCKPFDIDQFERIIRNLLALEV
jgi:ribose transport system substrate-binding protein